LCGNRWRYDLVALAGLFIATILGIIPADEAFSGFGHPAVVCGGDMATLIGTSPNIIIANYRAEITGRPFEMFDFSPVG